MDWYPSFKEQLLTCHASIPIIFFTEGRDPWESPSQISTSCNQPLSISYFAFHHPCNWLKCQHPPAKAEAMWTASVRLLTSWKHLPGCIKEKEKQNRKKYYLLSFLGRECSVSCPHTAHHPLTLHHLTATLVISITELICWFLPQGRQKSKQPLSEIREQRHTKITWIW